MFSSDSKLLGFAYRKLKLLERLLSSNKRNLR
jgi:hypothetical protein